MAKHPLSRGARLSFVLPRSKKMSSDLLQFESAGCKWWRKPFVRLDDRLLPAELAILVRELCPGESGVWLNSRGLDSGVTDLIGTGSGKFETKRIPLPEFVAEHLKRLYLKAKVKKGCPDLVIWNWKTKKVRLVEVKCPHWDRPSREQEQFMKAAESSGVGAKVVEWEFRVFKT